MRDINSGLWFVAITSLWLVKSTNFFDLSPERYRTTRTNAGWVVPNVTVPKFGQRVVRVELETREGLAPIDNVTVSQTTTAELVVAYGVEAEPADPDQTTSVFTFGLSHPQGTRECRLEIATPESPRVWGLRVSSHVPWYRVFVVAINILFWGTAGPWLLQAVVDLIRWVLSMPSGGMPSTPSGHHSPER
jgi:hypothetical protein